MKAKRILNILSAALMFVGLGSFTAEAQTYVNGFKDGGSASDSDYYEEATSDTDGYYIINNAGKLFWFANQINSGTIGTNSNAKLTVDINLENKAFPGIASYTSGETGAFTGTFDGKGHAISGFNRTSSNSNGHVGLFNHAKGATIKNFSLSGTMTISHSGSNFGSIVGLSWFGANSTFEDIHSSVDITVQGNVTPISVGGLFGRIQGTVNRCRYSGTLNANKAGKQIAGICGCPKGTFTVTNTLFDGKLITQSTATTVDNFRLGGIFGGHDNGGDFTIQNCLVNATITIPSTAPTGEGDRAGIIFGIGDLNSPYKVSVTNTYYTTDKVTKGEQPFTLLHGATTASKGYADNTTFEATDASTITWAAVRSALNGVYSNWGINGDKAVYPIPGEIDKDPTPATGSYDSNGFNTQFSTCAEEDKYQAATLVGSYYEIDNAGKMWWFANQILAGNASYNAKVTADINMDGSNYPDFPGIGFDTASDTDQRPFSGNFDGQGHRIYNCSITSKTGTRYGGGFIAYAHGTSKFIKDFTLEGTVTLNTGSGYAGGAIGYADQGYTISGITSSVNITTKLGKTGGVVGFASGGSISKCRYNGTLTSSTVNIGGIVGETNVKVSDCLFDGKIVSTQTGNAGSCVGGIAAVTRNVTIENCLVYGTITTAVTGASTSMVVGRTDYNNLKLNNIYYKAYETSTPTIAYNENSKTVTATNVTEITTETWQAIKTALNNGRVPTVWGISSQVYPVPGDMDNTQYTVTFDSKGGSECDSETNVANTVITLPAPTKSGYIFTGWDTKADGTGTRFQAGANYIITDNVTLYAQWALAYTVTFNTNGGSACEAVTKAAGTAITLPSPTKTDYVFNAWNTKEDGTGTSYAGGASYTITANATLYAQWTEDEAGNYRNGFKKTGSKSDADYYQAPVEVTSENYASLGLTSEYVGYYQVKNAGNMFWISKNFSSIENTRKYVMTDNIDMAGNDDDHKDWAGIATSYSSNGSTHFQGVFDGLGHKFTNYYMKVTSGSYKSLFGVVTKATIKNFSIEGKIDIDANGAQYGVVVGRFNEGPNTIEDIHSSVNITVTDGKKPSSVGGVVGQNSSGSNITTINRCRYSGTITGNSAFNGIGGIIGNTEGKLTMTNCLFDGKISSTSTAIKTKDADGIRIGGLAGGQTGQTLTIQNCLVVGAIEVNSSSEAVGNDSHSGIVFGDNSTTQNLTITNTYYRTTGCTSGLRAVGLNNYSDKTKAAPTLIEGQSWLQIKTSLNKGTTNWGINSQEYPVPGETDIASKYTITFDSMGGSDCPSVREVENTVITLPTPYWSGHAFDSWNTEEDGTGTSYNGGAAYTITADATLYAQWTFVASDFDADGFHISFAEVPDEMKYEAPELISSSRCNELGISTSYASSGYYEVKNAGNMFWISQNLSPDNNTRKYIVTADIDMKGNVAAHQNWTGIGEFINGNTDKNFKGTFDGNGHRFTNYYMLASTSYKAMFCVPNGATIKNFSVSGSLYISFENNYSSYNQIGVIAGRIVGTTTLEDIHSSVDITIKNGNTPISVGGLVGQCSATTTFNRCRYSGTINANSASTGIGGIFGNTEAAITLNNCLFDGSIISTSNQSFAANDYGGARSGVVIGGLGGVTNRALTIKNCMSIGTISIEQSSDKGHSGIILGCNGTDGNSRFKLTITNTYYRTSGSTSGVNAVGLNSAKEADQAAAAPTELVENPAWTTICENLGTDNWLIDYTEYQRYYPVPALGSVVVKDGCYYIRNVVQFQAFRDKVNSSAGARVDAKLVGNIDFGISYFGNPIGNNDNPYVGTFDGQGYSISNIRISSGEQFVGLFGNAGKDGDEGKTATIKNFSIGGTISTSYTSSNAQGCSEAHIGVIGRLANGSVEGVSSNVAFTNGSCTAAHFGGVVGCTIGDNSSKTIKNCQFTGSITADAWYAIGGILGYTQGNIVLSSNYFDGTINLSSCTRADANSYLGGILGYAGESSSLALLYNVSYGTLTPATSGTTHRGVILGYTDRTNGVYTDNYSKLASDNNSVESGKIANIIVASGLSAGEKTAKLGINWRVVSDGTTETLSPDNIISVDDQKNYVLKYIYIDDKADKLTWKYDNFENAATINALKIVYVRAAEYMDANYITTCLPFSLDESNLPGYNASGRNDLIVLQYNEMDNGDAIFLPVLNKNYQAGVPYLLKVPASAQNKKWSVTIEDENGITLIDTVKNPSSSSTNIFGSFETKVINTGYYKLYKGEGVDRFVKTRNGSHCFPYRAYLKVVSSSSQTSVKVKSE